jgi:hypothetical protein
MVREGSPLSPHMATLHIGFNPLVGLLGEVFMSPSSISAAIVDMTIYFRK